MDSRSGRPFNACVTDDGKERSMLTVFQGVTLMASALSMGLMAGVFGLYAHTIMPGLRHTDDRTFVGAFQSIDRAIINPWFMLSFVGALLVTGVAAALHLAGDSQSALPWIAIALVLYLAVFVVTIAINVPLNDAIKAAGHPDRISDLAGVRERVDEVRWASWNVFRAVATTVAFGCLAWALVEYGCGF
jgi:uncharacterized membrane protein